MATAAMASLGRSEALSARLCEVEASTSGCRNFARNCSSSPWRAVAARARGSSVARRACISRRSAGGSFKSNSLNVGNILVKIACCRHQSQRRLLQSCRASVNGGEEPPQEVEEEESVERKVEEGVEVQPWWNRLIEWSHLHHWMEIRKWSLQRWAAAVLAAALALAAMRVAYRSASSPKPSAANVAEVWLDWAIPEATPENIRRAKVEEWERTHPRGMKASRYVLKEDGQYHKDPNFAGEMAWQEEADASKQDTSAAQGDVAQEDWKVRLKDWEVALEKEELKERMEDTISKYEVRFDLGKMLEAGQEARAEGGGGSAGKPSKPSASFWLAKRWWKYRPSMPYAWLLRKIANNEVVAAVYSEDMRHLYVVMADGFPSEYKVNIPIDPYLYQQLSLRGVEMGILRRGPLSYLRGLAILAPSLLILWAINYVLYNFRVSMSEKLYDYIMMDRSNLILPEDARKDRMTQFDDVVMGPDVWQALEEILTYMRDPMKYHSRGIKLPRGILISGPPGTGKTLLARAIARECGLPFVFKSGAEFVDTNAMAGREQVFQTFFTARAMAPSFVFIDEIDALAGKSVVSTDAERRITFEQLLKELDGEIEHTDVDRFSLRQAVVLIAATNRPEALHADLRKPGRIDREIHIGLPAERERVEIFKVHSRDRNLAPDVDFSKLVFRTLGFSGADIRNLVNESAIVAVRKGHVAIQQSDIAAALDKSLFESLGIAQTADEEKVANQSVPEGVRRILAVHEAGHILLAHLFPQFDWHAFSHILPGGQESALSVFYPRQSVLDRRETTVGYLKMQMVVAQGGRCAERLVFGEEEVTDGGLDDLMKISKIARELAVSYANPRLGLMPLTYHPVVEPPAKPDEVRLIPNNWDRPGTIVANMSVPLSEMFTREVTRYVTESEAMAMEGLRANRAILDSLAETLFENFRMSGLEAEELVKSLHPIMLPDLSEGVEIDPEELIKAGPSSWNPNKPGRYEELEIYPAPLHRC